MKGKGGRRRGFKGGRRDKGGLLETWELYGGLRTSKGKRRNVKGKKHSLKEVRIDGEGDMRRMQTI